MTTPADADAGAQQLAIVPVAGLPEIRAGDDLAAAIVAGCDLRDGDVLVVASKVVSKAEGATRRPAPGETPQQARMRLTHEHAARLVASAPWVTIVETHHGFVCANAGIDASNVPGDDLVVLPDDPDASAAALRSAVRDLAGVDVGVVVSDTFGRPWRVGQTDVALGVAGVPALRSEIGGRDREGRRLDVTEAAVADELAAAADLVRAKGNGVAVVVVRGLVYEPDDAASGRDLLRPAETDLFPRGRGGLADALVGGTTAFTGPVDDRDLWRVQAVVEQVCGQAVRLRRMRPRDRRPGTEIECTADDPVPAGVAAGLVLALLSDLGYGAVLVEAVNGPTVWAGRP